MNKKEIKNLIGEGATILEIGCADGKDTLDFLTTFESCKIYAIEPDPRNIKVFRETIRDPRAKLFEIAIGDKDGKTTFNQSSTIYSSSLKEPDMEKFQKSWSYIYFEDKIEVEVKTIDTFIKENNIEKVDFIWADVQGAEDLMLKGAKNSLDKIRYIYTEYDDEGHYKNCPTKQDILDILGENWSVVEDFKTDILLKNETIR